MYLVWVMWVGFHFLMASIGHRSWVLMKVLECQSITYLLASSQVKLQKSTCNPFWPPKSFSARCTAAPRRAAAWPPQSELQKVTLARSASQWSLSQSSRPKNGKRGKWVRWLMDGCHFPLFTFASTGIPRFGMLMTKLLASIKKWLCWGNDWLIALSLPEQS